MVTEKAAGEVEAQVPSGWRLVRFDTVDSTNEQARRLIAGGAEHGTVVVADVQTGGRGRHGRKWTSPRGNLHCSIIVHPHRPQREVPQLSLLTGVAVAEALASVAPHSVFRAKWPNDILCRGRKLCGILLENAEPSVIVGIGVDVASAPGGEVLYPTTSLAEEGCRAGVEEVLAAICQRMDRWLRRWEADGFEPIRSAWLERAGGIGEPVVVRTEDRDPLRGTLVGLDTDGALLIQEAVDGPPRRILAGDVHLVRSL
ncbi:MAG: biotin--[acetyl-CoA-carboxylase] ligase [Alphaproteobacteria bacterium]